MKIYWTDEWKARALLAVIVLLTAIMAFCAQGCASCEPKIIRQVEVIEAPPEIITILPPEVRVPTMPVLESIDNAALASVDPAAWLRLVAADFVQLVDALEAARGELIAVNEARNVE